MFTVRLENIKIRQDLSNDEVAKIAYTKFNIPQESITDYKIVKKSIDARDKNDIFYNYSIVVLLKENFKVSKLLKNKNASLIEQEQKQKTVLHNALKAYNRPVIIGAGPAGLFCALTLIENGVKPIIVEQGKTVEERQKDVELFLKERILNTCSNVQFGEGGAGTFSDGKLTTNLHSPLCRDVIDTFVKFGAPKEISYINKPHIGTDILRIIVKNIREKIKALGGEIFFNSQVTDFIIKDDKICGVEINHKEKFTASDVFLGIGHSARDTYELLYSKGISMEAKPFAIGVRIEHPQDLIDKAQYGEDYKSELLPVADYSLTYNNRQKGRSVYSFCMCPGGQVVAAASELGRVVVNGMSNYKRNSGIANSALLVNVTPDDFGHNVLDGIAFQRHYEEMAYICGGRNYHAPVQTVGDFLKDKVSDDNFLVEPTYKPGVKICNLRECLPDFTTQMLAEALPNFDKKIPGFAGEHVVMTGVEMRSSAPCRIIRNRQTYMSENVKGLYPIGEGAGYAGGIMSAAVDGVNAAYAYIENIIE